MKDLMVDLETLGNEPGCIIVQIGACYFDRDTGEIGATFSKNIDARDAKKLGFEESIDTVLWWIDQPKSAQDAVFKHYHPMIEVLNEFSLFANKAESVWSHATFDFTIIMATYKKLGMLPPFHYKTACDLRTICKLSKIDLKSRVRTGIQHNGLDDCLFQVAYTVEALKMINK